MKTIVVLLSLFCLCQGTEKSKGSGCPKGWIRFRDSDRCYYVSNNFDTFDKANKYCLEKKSQLVPPLEYAEQYDLNEVLVDHRERCHQNQDCDEFWIGIHNLTGGKWRTGKGLEIDNYTTFETWDIQFPKDDEGSCVMMSFKGTKKNKGAWKNTDCTRKLKFVCITCPNNFDYFPEINECLYAYRKPLKYTLAQKTCASMKKGAHLVTIQSALKQEVVGGYVSTFVTEIGTANCDYEKGDIQKHFVWLGAQSTDPNDCKTPFVWKTCGKDPIPISYNNFIPGLPACSYPAASCAIIMTLGPKQWIDLTCNDIYCFICEF